MKKHNKKTKIRHVYTVVREREIPEKDLEEDIRFFERAMTDETGEFLYGGCADEDISGR